MKTIAQRKRGTNPNPSATKLRIGYTSLVTPNSVFDFDFETRTLETLKVQEIPPGMTPVNSSPHAWKRPRVTAPSSL